MTRPTSYRAPPQHLAIGNTSYWTHDFEGYLCRHEVDPAALDPAALETARQVFRAAMLELATEKPYSWSVLAHCTVDGVTRARAYEACAAREGCTVAAVKSRYHRAVIDLKARAQRLERELAAPSI